MDHLRRAPRSAVAAFATLVGVVALAVFVVLPAFATSVTYVPPPSYPGNVTPTLIPVGGQSDDCAQFAAGNYQQYLNPNPQTGTYSLGGNASVTLTLNPDPSGYPAPSGTKGQWPPAYASDTYVSFTVSGATVYDVFVKGGSQTTLYTYGSGTTGDGYLHAPAQSVDKKTGEPTQLYSISHMTFCFLPGAPISGKATVDGTGTGGLTVSLTDTTTNATTTTTTASDGTYGFPAEPVGDGYTICISKPTTDTNGYTQTTPGSGGATCSGTGQAPNGYTVSSLGSGGSSGNDFAFASLGSISGTVYEDKNQNGSYDSTPTDSPQSGWTVTLSGGPAGFTAPPPATTDSNGKYSFTGLPAGTYTICETAGDSGTWAQTEPAPGSGNVCSSPLTKGYGSISLTPGQSLTGQDFGNVAATNCTPDTPIGPDAYQVEFHTCKPGESYFFNSGTTSGGKPFVSITPSDQTNTQQEPLVEKITWPYDPTGGQNQFELLYTDAYPYNLSNLQEMPFCQVDPRTGPDSLTLGSSYNQNTDKGSILPGGGATSCLISTTTSAAGTYTAYVYSDVDGLRAPN